MKCFQKKVRYHEKALKVIKISLFVLTLLSTLKKGGNCFQFFGPLTLTYCGFVSVCLSMIFKKASSKKEKITSLCNVPKLYL